MTGMMWSPFSRYSQFKSRRGNQTFCLILFLFFFCFRGCLATLLDFRVCRIAFFRLRVCCLSRSNIFSRSVFIPLRTASTNWRNFPGMVVLPKCLSHFLRNSTMSPSSCPSNRCCHCRSDCFATMRPEFDPSFFSCDLNSVLDGSAHTIYTAPSKAQ